MKTRSAAWLLALGMVACGPGETKKEAPAVPGLEVLRKECQSEPTQVCLEGLAETRTVLGPKDGALGVRLYGASDLEVDFAGPGGKSDFRLRFALPPGGKLVRAPYRRTGPPNAPGRKTAGLSFLHGGEVCEGEGTFVIYGLGFEDEKVGYLDSAFEVPCPGGRTARGRVRFNMPKPKVAVGVGPALRRLMERQTERSLPLPQPNLVTQVSLETLDRFCPDRKSSFFCLWSQTGESRRFYLTEPPSAQIRAEVHAEGQLRAFAAPVNSEHGELVEVQLGAPAGEALRASAYEDARCEPSVAQHVPTQHQQPFLRMGWTCQGPSRGRFQIRDLQRGAGTGIAHATIDFEIRGERGDVTVGRVRVQSETAPPEVAGLPPLPTLDGRPAEAFCHVDSKDFFLWDGVWYLRGTENEPVDRTVTFGTDSMIDNKLYSAGYPSVQWMMAPVRLWLDAETIEILPSPEDAGGAPYAPARCEVQGEVQPPRPVRLMGTSLAARLRQDQIGPMEIQIRYLVRRTGEAWDLVSAEGLRPEYRELLEQDLRQSWYEPALLDGHPVEVYQTETLRF